MRTLLTGVSEIQMFKNWIPACAGMTPYQITGQVIPTTGSAA